MCQCLYRSLPYAARESFINIALMEYAAIMQYTLSGEDRAWLSLSRECKIQWLPKDFSCLLNAPANWQQLLNEFGWRDKTDPASAVCLSLDDLDPSVADILRDCCRTFQQEEWVQEVARHHQLQVGPMEVRTGLPAEATRLKREVDCPASCSTGLPAKAVKKEPCDAHDAQTFPSGREISKRLLSNLPYRPLDASMLDLGQVLRGCLAVARNFHGNRWPEHITILSCGDLASRHGQNAHMTCGLLCSETHWALLCISEGQGIVYDGLGDTVCFNQASAYMAHLRESGHAVKEKLLKAQCPKQGDAWSCGHRVIVALGAILDHVESVGDIPRQLDESVLSSAHVQALVRSSQDSSFPNPCQQQGPPKHVKRKVECVQSSVSNAAPGADVASEPSTPKRSRPRVDDKAMTPPRPSPPARTSGFDGLKLSPVSNTGSPRQIVSKASKPVRSKLIKGNTQKETKQSTQSEASLVKRGESLCQSAGVQHNTFQSEHYHASQPEPRGHWKMFLRAVAVPDDKGKILTCPVCCSLRNKIVNPAVPSAPEPSNVKAEPSEDVSLALVAVQPPGEASRPVLGPQIHKRGRPAKGESMDSRWRLGVFIQQHRASVYRQLKDSWGKDATYHCIPCGRDIKFKTHTCKRKLDKHEKGITHIKGLEKLGLPLPKGVARSTRPGSEDEAEEDEEEAEDQPAGQQHPVVAVDLRCNGLPPHDITSPLHCLKCSIESFVLAGQPRTTYAPGETDPFADVIFDSTPQGIYVKSRQCQGSMQRDETFCVACKALGRWSKFRSAVAQKAYMIDLAMYSHKLFHCPQDQLEAFMQDMVGRDYRQLGLAGADFEGLCQLRSKLAQVAKVRQKFENTPAWRISVSYQNFMRQWLPKTDLFHPSDTQASARASLVAALGQGVLEGKVRALDLEVASRIAAGALRSDALVDGLVTTFVQTLQSSLTNKRRQTSSQFMQQEALVDAIHTLGRGSECQALMSRFKVNKQSLPKLSLNHASMPDSFNCFSTRPPSPEEHVSENSKLLEVRFRTSPCDLR